MTDRERIAEVERFLDNFNAEYGDSEKLCLFCHAKEYDGRSGILHSLDCVILSLRSLLAGYIRQHELPVDKVKAVAEVMEKFECSFAGKAWKDRMRYLRKAIITHMLIDKEE